LAPPAGQSRCTQLSMGGKTETRARGPQTEIAERLGFTLNVLAAVWLVLAVAPCSASLRHPELAVKAYQRAVELQQNLEAKPSAKRTAAEYKRVIREYRNVYYYDFAYVKAPVAAETMGDLYVEMGRRFHDSTYFKSAIKYYQYAASQYPGTSMARESALAVGDVYLESLNDPDQAADAYRAFLEKYPRSAQSREAQKKLKEIADLQAVQKGDNSAPASSPPSPEATNEPSPPANGGPVEVTEIHKWVGPNFTRVVIGARGPFQYNTLRLSHPDRIVFDLPNTHARPGLLNKGVPIDGAFLRDIRVGQFKPNVTRIVLDVKDISDYSAFPVPNPYRLIIDVHGTPSETARNAPVRGRPAFPAAAESGRNDQEAVEERTSMLKQASISRPKSQVEIPKHIEQLPIPKGAPAIEYQDQEAVKEKAEATANHGAKEVSKQKTGAVPEHRSQPLPKTKAEEAASGPDIQETQRARDKIASVDHDQQEAKSKAVTEPGHETRKDAISKTEEAAVRQVSHLAKNKVELASNKTRKEALPISTKPASPTEDGSQTLTRALGLKVARIVIDPGHGGFDTGTIGSSGLEEKNLVLDIGLRLRKLIETRTNSEVFMTRSTDKFIPLEERTAIANEDGADLFISIHANASRDRHVRGIETYFLNFTSDPEALRLAARENATSQESVHQLQNLIKKIALNNKIEESQELARDIQTALYKRISRVSGGIHNRGVRKAPFVVLIGANMPCILTEISFLSNPHSERLLRTGSYREQIAKALFNGIEDYIANLGSVRMAQRTR
jgi:N-acetylmuramoyl-L-alanine amidase